MVCVWRIVWRLRDYLGMSEPKVRWRSNLFWSIWLTACKLRSSPNGNLVCGLPRHLLKTCFWEVFVQGYVYYFIQTFNCLVALMSAFLVLAHCPHMCDMDKHKGNLSDFSFQLSISCCYTSQAVYTSKDPCASYIQTYSYQSKMTRQIVRQWHRNMLPSSGESTWLHIRSAERFLHQDKLFLPKWVICLPCPLDLVPPARNRKALYSHQFSC